jgi:rifampicin phosphotransferase
MEKLVLPLSASRKVSLVGGKAASLARLMQAGFNVPTGFVATTTVQELNDELERDILSAFDELGAKYVAVRSSAVAEDGVKDAWAGQMDTFLNVNRGELVEAIRKCWESAKSERAKAYAEQKNIRPGNVAVIVQKMVPARASGVAFSAHPVTNNRGQIVIESVRGLGEKLVSGSVTPDTYVIDKETQEVIEKHPSEETQNLSSRQLEELAETVLRIEDLFGLPVDVEWAYAGSELFILQSRPITTLG